jgi:hypothetical protein
MTTVGQSWWQTLTPTQRNNWAAKAAQTSNTNSIGQKYHPTASNLYISRNMNALLAGGTPILDAPNDVVLTHPGPTTVTADSTAYKVLVTPTVYPPAGYGIIVQATGLLTRGISNYNKYLHDLLIQATPLWVPTLTAPSPVPPWTAGANYTPAHWVVTGSTLNTSPGATTEWIIAGITITDATITVPLSIKSIGTLTSIMAARLNTTTYAGYTLSALPNQRLLQLWKSSAAASPRATIVANATIPSLGSTQHTWQWVVKGTTNTVYIDGTKYMNVQDSSFTTGDVALPQVNAGIITPSYDATYALQSLPTLPDITSNWLTNYIAIQAPYLVAISLRYINLTTGQATPKITASCIST